MPEPRTSSSTVAQESHARVQNWLHSIPAPPASPVLRRARPQNHNNLHHLTESLQTLHLPHARRNIPPPPPPPPPSSATSNRPSPSPSPLPTLSTPPTPPPMPSNLAIPTPARKTPPPPPPSSVAPPAKPRPPNYAPPVPIRPTASRPPPVPSTKQSSQQRIPSTSTRSRMERDESRLSAQIPSGYSRKHSERITAAPSDLGSGIERVVSEHLGLIPVGSAHGPLLRVDSTASGVAAENPVAALRLTFMSIKSYGNTDKSSGSLGEDANVDYGALLSSSGKGLASAGSFAQFRQTWSSAGVGLPSRVEEAAGGLYRAGSIDEKWLIGKQLGAGAFSEVRFGEGRAGEGCVAIKIVNKSAPDLFCPSGSCREVVACRMIGEHPNLVKCLEVFEDDRFIYIVIELLSGGQMLPRIACSKYYPRYCENDVVRLVRCLVRALAHMHAKGIAHRDVKPENILYATDTLDPTVKLTDFGIAHTACNLCPADDMVGTPLYVAPEVVLRMPYGCAADMWSLGVIVHILLTGYPPFDDDDLVQLINKVKHSPLRMLGEEWVVISEEAQDFVTGLLTRDISERLTADQALAHPWLSKPRPPPFPAPPRPSRALNPPLKVEIPPTRQSTKDGTIPLMVAQYNLQAFVARKEWKRMVERDSSDRDLKLSMLVSLSEKDLGNGEPIRDASYQKAEPERKPLPDKEKSSHGNSVNEKQPGVQVIPASRPKTPGSVKRERLSTSRETSDLEHQQEQERLRQQRLLLQADISKKKKLKARKGEESSDRATSLDTGTLSIHSSPLYNEASHDPMMTSSKCSDESSTQSDPFQFRRDADAGDDVEKIQRQRNEAQQAKVRGTLIGRRGRQSSTAKQSAKSEKVKPPKPKGKTRKKQKQVVPSSQGTRLTSL